MIEASLIVYVLAMITKCIWYYLIFLGNLWEELREDNLISDPQVPTTTSSTNSDPQGHHSQTSCLLTPSPVTRRKAEYEDENTDGGQNFEQHGYLNGLHPVAYSGVESLAGYLTSCATTISLM